MSQGGAAQVQEARASNCCGGFWAKRVDRFAKRSQLRKDVPYFTSRRSSPLHDRIECDLRNVEGLLPHPLPVPPKGSWAEGYSRTRQESSLNALCLSDSLRRELVVGTRCSIDGAVDDANEKLGLLPAAIEAEDELVEVALEVLRADAVEGSVQPGLQVPENGVCAGQQVDGLGTVTALARAVVDSEVAECHIGHPTRR